MNTKRTEVDFSKHVVEITKQEGLFVCYIRVPGTITNSVKFINTNDIMAVTGDFGNWIFCREFHPSATGGVSDGLLCVGILAEAIGDDAILFVDATLHLGLAAAGGDRKRHGCEQGRGDLERTLHLDARVAGGAGIRGREEGVGNGFGNGVLIWGGSTP